MNFKKSYIIIAGFICLVSGLAMVAMSIITSELNKK
jgi:hypothetical protein